jgi:hypothetical protein
MKAIGTLKPMLGSRHRLLVATLILFALSLSVQTARANGIPVQVFLNYLPLKSTWAPAGDGRGLAVISANDEQVQVMVQNMPEPPDGSAYHAWLELVEGGFLSVGVLSYRSDGTASLNQSVPGLPYSENFSWVLVSVEPAGEAREAPGADIALAGRLPNPVALPGPFNEPPQLLPVTGSAPDGFLGSIRALWQVLLHQLGER